MVRIQLDRELCKPCGTCESVCPAIFKQDRIGVTVNDEEIMGNSDAAILAVDICPFQALTFIE